MASRALRGNEVILRRAVYAEFSLNEMRLLGNPLQQSNNPKRPFECPDLFIGMYREPTLILNIKIQIAPSLRGRRTWQSQCIGLFS
jgi:hypothetical protein